MNVTEKTAIEPRTLFSKQEEHEIFEQWLDKIQQIMRIIEYRGPFNQQKIYEFFSSFMNVIRGGDSFTHFQLLDGVVPYLKKYQISEQDIFLVLSHLREIILQKLLEKGELHPEVLHRILQKFDEVVTFTQRSVLMQMQFEKEENPLNLHSVIDRISTGVFFIEGERFAGKFYPNLYLKQFLGWKKEEPLSADFWKKHLKRSERKRLDKFFKELYSRRTKNYRVQYHITVNKTDRLVLEEGTITYSQTGEPLTISGTLQTLNLLQKLKERLVLEQKKYQLLRQLSAHLIIMCDSRGRIINYNPSLLKILRVSSEKFLGSHLLDWFTLAEGEKVKSFRELLKYFREARNQSRLLQMKQPNWLSFKTRLGILKTPNNTHQYLFVGWQSGVLDVQLKNRLDLLIEIQKELILETKREDLHQKILDKALLLLPVADAGSILRVEPDGLHFEASRGYDSEKLKHVVLFKGNLETYLKHSTQVQMLTNGTAIQEISHIKSEAEKILCPRDLDILKKYGRLEEIKTTLTGIIYRDGQPALLVNLDILDAEKFFSENDKYLFNIYLQQVYVVLHNQQLVEKIQESENNYRTLFENSPLPSFIHQNNKFTLVNPKFYEMTGYTPEDISELSIWDLVHPEDKSMMVERAYKRLRGEEVPSEYEFRAIKKTGEILHCIGYFSLITFDGKPAILGEVSDISRIKSLEKQLIQAQKLETIGTLTAGIAHDFNNIIGTIAPSAQLIMIDPYNPQTKKRAEIIYKMAQRAGKLTSQLLSFSRNEKSEVTTFNLNKLIEDSISLIEKSISPKTKLHLDLEKNLKFIEGDATQFIQIIMNLVVNANDAMPNGGELTIQTRNVYADASYKSWDTSFQEGEYVMFSVKDTGTGIPPEIRDKIFDPFFTTKKRGKGTGLGLSMVYGITKSHNGIILVKSEEGKGTEFQLFFPASTKRGFSGTTDEVAVPKSQGGTILAIDDEKDLRVILESILKYLGYRVYLAENGKQGLDLYRKHHEEIDLVLLDYILPDIDGLEIFQRLKEINPEVKVLICSGYSEQEGLQELIRSGVKGVLPKPFTIETIAKKIQEIIPQ